MREKQHQRGLSSSYLEPDRYDDEEGEEAISLAAIKSKYKGGGGLRGRGVRRGIIPVQLKSSHPFHFSSPSHCGVLTVFCYLLQRSAPRFTRQTVTKARTTTKPRG